MKVLIVFGAFLCFTLVAFGQETKYFSNKGIAINGYDPVAYFTEGRAVAGKAEFSVAWKGVEWLFASSGNRKLFVENPDAYAPQYGGYCAFGASDHHLAPTDPQAWTIIGSKLFLNYSPAVKSQWLPDTARRIPLANAYWMEIQKSN